MPQNESAPGAVLTEERKAFERLLFRGVTLVLVVVGLSLSFPVLWHYLSPFIVSIPIAACLQPLIRFLEKKLKWKHSLAVLLPVLALVAVAFLLIYWFASFGFSQLNTLITNAPNLISEGVSTLRSAFNRAIGSMEGIPPETVAWLENAMNQFLNWLTTQGTMMGGRILGFTANMATMLPAAFIYLNFLIVAMYLVTKAYDTIRSRLPGGRDHDPNTSASQLTKSAMMGLTGYLRVQLTYGIISFVVGLIYLNWCRFPYAWAIALLAAILEFLPLFGNGTLYIPWSIIAFVMGMGDVGTKVIVLYLLLITFRRITEPRIMSASIGVSPLLSMIGMFIGMRVGGLLGMIGGPVVMSVLVSVIRGPYLNGARRDWHTLVTFFCRRWGWKVPPPYQSKWDDILVETPEKNEKKPRKSLLGRFKKK